MKASYMVYTSGKQWGVRKSRAKRAIALFDLRRDAIKRAKELAGKDGNVTVMNASGMVVVRIPEPEQVAAQVWIKRASDMSAKGRRDIAAWLRQHADFLTKEGGNYASNFRGRYIYT